MPQINKLNLQVSPNYPFEGDQVANIAISYRHLFFSKYCFSRFNDYCILLTYIKNGIHHRKKHFFNSFPAPNSL